MISKRKTASAPVLEASSSLCCHYATLRLIKQQPMISWSKQWNAVTCGDIKLKVYPNPVSMDSKPTFVKNSILFHVIIQ